MSVLFTGGTGYLGSRLLRALVHGPYQRVTVLVRKTSHLGRIADLLSFVDCVEVEECRFPELIETRGIDTIVHCATSYGRNSVPRPDIVDANLVLPLRLLEAASRVSHRVSFINTDTMLDKRISVYSMSKKQFRDWLEVYSDSGACINVALEHFFGPGDDPSKFVTFVVQALLRGDARIALTAGHQQRDFVYIDDVVDAFLRILEFARGAKSGFFEFQIGRGNPMSIREFVGHAKRLCGNTTTVLDFGALPDRPNEVLCVDVDTDRIRELGWVPAFDIEHGLRCMIEKERPWRENSLS